MADDKFVQWDINLDGLPLPRETLKVTFPPSNPVNLGTRLIPTITQTHPQIFLLTNNDYTLVLMDLDAPGTKPAQWLHWIVTYTKANGKWNSVVSYYPPSPPPNSGIHRYVFLQFRGAATNIPNSRTHFMISDFAKKNNLGYPIAGNFFIINS
jgi:phosphatidylethanolamine-binding protein